MNPRRVLRTRWLTAGVRVAAAIAVATTAWSEPQATPANPQAAATPPPPTTEAPKARRVDPRADEILKKMGELLAGTKQLALEAEETFDEVYEQAPRVQLTNVRRIALERPARFAADATGDTLNRASWYDGRTLSVLNKEQNAYVSVEMPDSIDAVLDKVADEYGVVIPLSDLLYADPYGTLTEGVLYGEYLGLHHAAGVLCHHLAFSQADIDWQIWIEAGDKPLPRKLVITYVKEPGAPQYAATIKRITLGPKFAEDLFRFEAPAGARRIEPAEVLRREKPLGAQPGKPNEEPKEEKP